MMDNHTSSSPTSCFLFENTNGSIYPSDLVLTMIEDGSPSSSSSPTNSNGSLSPSSSSNQSFGLNSNTQMSFPCCLFRCRPNSHPFQERCIPLNEPVKVGRAVARLKALPNNAIFDCKVLSRQHAKLWYENGKFLLQDTKSSNGTFVNNQRLGKCNEESLPFEIFSGDIIQCGVDVTENNRKTTHNCIIIEVKLYHNDGSEALSRSPVDRSLGQVKELDINNQALYQLAQYLQEAMHREQMLEQKLEYLQSVIRDTQQASNDGWQAIIDEDRLLARIDTLEEQIRVYHAKHPNENIPIQEIVQLKQSNSRFEKELKEKLEKALLDRVDAISRSKSLESSLQIAQTELKRLEEQNDLYKQETQNLIQSIEDQRSLLVDLENKFHDSQTRSTDLENERQRIQTEFEDYYQRTHHLEELQQQQEQKSQGITDQVHQNGINNVEIHGRFQIQSPSKQISLDNHEVENLGNNHEESNQSPQLSEQRQTLLPTIQKDSIVNHNHENHDDKLDETNDESIVNDNNEPQNYELIEAHNQIEFLREHLNDTKDRLASLEETHRSETERYSLLTNEYESLRDEFTELKQRSNREQTEHTDLIERQQNQLDHLSKNLVSKQNEHEQLLSVYLCFFLSSYLLIFFLFFCLLSW